MKRIAGHVRVWTVFVSLFLPWALSSCGGGNSAGTDQTPITSPTSTSPTSKLAIHLTQSSLASGGGTRLWLTGTATGIAEWTTSSGSITPDDQGASLVAPDSPGALHVTVTRGGEMAQAMIQVLAPTNSAQAVTDAGIANLNVADIAARVDAGALTVGSSVTLFRTPLPAPVSTLYEASGPAVTLTFPANAITGTADFYLGTKRTSVARSPASWITWQQGNKIVGYPEIESPEIVKISGKELREFIDPARGVVRITFQPVDLKSDTIVRPQTLAQITGGLYPVHSLHDLDGNCGKTDQRPATAPLTDATGSVERPALVLVHGWTGSDPGNYDFNTLAPAACYWKSWLSSFFANGWDKHYDLYSYGYDSLNTGVIANSVVLAQTLKKVLAGRSVTVVAHSMGGMVTTRAIFGEGLRINNLVTLGTPYLGSAALTCTHAENNRCTDAKPDSRVVRQLTASARAIFTSRPDVELMLQSLQYLSVSNQGTRDLSFYQPGEITITCPTFNNWTISIKECPVVQTVANPLTADLASQVKNVDLKLFSRRTVSFVGDAEQSDDTVAKLLNKTIYNGLGVKNDMIVSQKSACFNVDTEDCNFVHVPFRRVEQTSLAHDKLTEGWDKGAAIEVALQEGVGRSIALQVMQNGTPAAYGTWSAIREGDTGSPVVWNINIDGRDSVTLEAGKYRFKITGHDGSLVETTATINADLLDTYPVLANLPTTVPCSLQSFVVTPETLTLYVGESKKLNATVKIGPDGCTGQAENNVLWSSNNQGSVEVDSTGNVHALMPTSRSVTITATIGISVRTVSVNVTTVVPITVGAKSTTISAGDEHSLALKSDGTLWAFGNNAHGQLGDGTTTNRYSPVMVMSGVASVDAGLYHSLALKSDGTLWAFGANFYGQLGDGTTTERHSPVMVMSGVASVSAGGDHSLALKSDGTLWAFGWNSSGQLGDGTTTNRYSPMMVMSGVASVNAGGYHSLALKSDGTLWTFGWNPYGQLGDGTTTSRYSPVVVMSGVANVSAGNYHSLALKSDGTLWAFGWNTAGQLGDGTTTERDSPSPVKVMSGVVGVSAGGEYSLTLKSDGTLWGFGYNASGQLGDSTTTARVSPVIVMSGVASVSAGSYHSLALKSDGTLWGFGYNAIGQLGDGTTTSRYSPVMVMSGVALPR